VTALFLLAALATLLVGMLIALADAPAMRGFGILARRLVGKAGSPVPRHHLVPWGLRMTVVVGLGLLALLQARPADRPAMLGILTGFLFSICLVIAALAYAFRPKRRNDTALPATSAPSVAPVPTPSGSGMAGAIRHLAGVLLVMGAVAFAFLVPLRACSSCSSIGKVEILGQTLNVCKACDGDGRQTLWEMIKNH
jgi:amino acid transporter